MLRAGYAPSNNLIRSMKAGARSIFVVGAHDDPFVLKRSLADRNYLIPDFSRTDFGPVLRELVKKESIDLVIPNTEDDVRLIAELRHRLPCRTFLPASRVIDLCRDKYKLCEHLRHHGLPVARTYAVKSLDRIDDVFRRFAPGSILWCRVRTGIGSFGAIPVKTAEHARSWMTYWKDMRGVSPRNFTLSEYLPGADYCVQSLWRRGKLVLTKMHQRLSYYVPGSSASGVSSTAALAKMIMDRNLAEVCKKAIKTLDRRASGVFFLDVKENDRGIACITEINAGRFANVPTIDDAVAKFNTASIYVRLAMGMGVVISNAYEPAAGRFVMRGIDAEPANQCEQDLLEGLCEMDADTTVASSAGDYAVTEVTET